MANLARSAIVFNKEWSEGRNKSFLVRDVTMTLTGQGGATNKILASVLGLLEVVEVRSAVKSDNTIVYGAAPAVDGSFILLTVAGAPGTPADVTATVRAIVVGRTM